MTKQTAFKLAKKYSIEDETSYHCVSFEDSDGFIKYGTMPTWELDVWSKVTIWASFDNGERVGY